LTEEHAREAFSLACEVFVKSSVLHASTDISVEEYRNYMSPSFQAMTDQGLSLVAVDTHKNELVGCLVACDYLTDGSELTDTPDSMKPINAILNDLDSIYRKKRPQLQYGQCMLVDIAAVSPASRGKGIYRLLRETAHQLGREKGFNYVVGELSSMATQRLCVDRFKHEIIAEIEYSTYEFMSRLPFSEIRTPQSILLVEGELE